jgi:hypothetical protein
VAPVPIPLSAPRVPLGFPPLAAASGQTARLGGPTAPKIEAGGQTVSSGGQTALRTEVGGLTASPGGRTHPPP